MKYHSRILTMALITALLLMASSCQTPAGRSPGQVVDDATITTRVKSKLFEDKVLSGFSISVTTFQGEVTLVGAVLSEGLKDRATNIAESVAGVRKVNNLLTIKD